jgi:hypothetical protein
MRGHTNSRNGLGLCYFRLYFIYLYAHAVRLFYCPGYYFSMAVGADQLGFMDKYFRGDELHIYCYSYLIVVVQVRGILHQ